MQYLILLLILLEVGVLLEHVQRNLRVGRVLQAHLLTASHPYIYRIVYCRCMWDTATLSREHTVQRTGLHECSWQKGINAEFWRRALHGHAFARQAAGSSKVDGTAQTGMGSTWWVIWSPGSIRSKPSGTGTYPRLSKLPLASLPPLATCAQGSTFSPPQCTAML